MVTCMKRLMLGFAAVLALSSCGEEPASEETRCGGGAPQCCCDFKREVDRYERSCRASCEEDAEDQGWACVSDTACGF
jgi:hypothetical protein